MKLRLDKYPAAISTVQRQILDLEETVLLRQKDVHELSHKIEKQIVFDPALKNDAQRNAARYELEVKDEPLALAYRNLQNERFKLDTLKIELEELRNKFSVSKLEHRLLIASWAIESSFG